MQERKWARGSVHVLDYLIRPNGLSLSAQARLVYLCLFSYCNDQFTCWPSIPTIAEGVGISESTVQRRIKELAEAGLVDVERRAGESTVYHLHPPWKTQKGRTPVSLTPLSERHPCQPDTPPLSERHPTPVTLTPEVTQGSNSGKKLIHLHDYSAGEAQKTDEKLAGPSELLAEVERYVSANCRTLMASAADIAEMERWLELTGGDLQLIRQAIDAGVAVFQKDRPNDLPRNARFFGGFVDKQWDRANPKQPKRMAAGQNYRQRAAPRGPTRIRDASYYDQFLKK